MQIDVIVPAYNESKSIEKVIRAIPRTWVHRIIVVDNNSTDDTAKLAEQAGAMVLTEKRKGYGSACLRGMLETTFSDIIVFLDADFSDDPSYLPELVKPILHGEYDMVIGNRILGPREKGALPVHALFGNRLACWLIDVLFGMKFGDLGPFRAIRRDALDKIKMKDPNYGWTVEMQVKAALYQLRCTEIPVPYRKRIGRSKISGSVIGSVKAGYKILATIAHLWWKRESFKNDRT